MEHSTLAGYSILLVEPDPAKSRDLQRALDGAGAHVLCTSVSEDALDLADAVELSGAVLNFTQSVRDGHRVATRLSGLGIPFVLCRQAGLDMVWPRAAILTGPFSDAVLVETLRHLFDTEPRGDEPEAEGTVQGAPEETHPAALLS